MKEINLKDIILVPILSTLRRVEMSDEEYFSDTYKGYVSNSRLKNINPLEGGSPSLYKNPPRLSTSSLALGSVVHQRILQPEEFELAPKIGKPSAKLGACIDYIIKYRKEGKSILNSIYKASIDADYYANQLTPSRIKYIIEKGLKYYLNSKTLKGNEIVLSDADYDKAIACIDSVSNNRNITRTLHPDSAESYNEDAMFIDYAVIYKGKVSILKYKMKIDNWTIDKKNKVLCLNDLKTTYKPVTLFMNPEYGSLYHYHYYRQFALYGDILKLYCMKEFGYNEKDWNFKSSVLVVSTSEPYDSRKYYIDKSLLRKGREEYRKLLKMVGYYEIFGYKEEVKFV